MANTFDQFDSTESNQFDQFDATTETEPGMFDFITGESRMTDRMREIPEISRAPELSELSVPAFKASIGLLTSGDTKSLKGIFSSQFGEKVSFDEDEKGNTIINFPSGPYALNKPGLSQEDIVRGVFDVLAFTPAGRGTSIAAAAVKSGATEAVLSGVEESVGGEEVDVKEVGASALLGGFFKGAENLIGAGYRAFKGQADNALVDAGTDAGVPLLTSDVNPPTTFPGKMAQQTAEKIPFAGTGGIREKQQVLREAAVQDVADRYGQFSYEAIIDSLKNQKNRVKSAAGSVLENAGNKLDDIGEIPMNNTLDVITEVESLLSKPGVIQSKGAIADLQTLTDTLLSTPQSFTTLKENRTAFRDIVAGADKADRSQLSSRAKTLLGKVETAIKSDMSEFAEKNLTPREFSQWNKANQVYFDEAQKLTKTRLKNVLDKGDTTPESVQTLLFSQKPSEVKSLYSSLTANGRANARSAIISKTIEKLSKRQGGLTPNSFESELNKSGLQIDTFFKGEEKKQLKGLLDVLDATRRAQDAAITTPTGQSLMGAGTGYAAFTDLTGTVGSLGTLGTLAKLYESAPVRNALLRVASVPKGSTGFEKALAEAVDVMSASAQTARRQSEETQ